MYRNGNFDSPYAANAPMWSDFDPNPNISSDYFDVLHPETETPFTAIPEKLRLKTHDVNSSSLLTTQNGQSTSTFMDTLDTINMTPIKVVSPKGKKGKAEVVKETTVEDVLNDVMGIVSSASKQRRRTAVNLNKTPGTPAPADNTPAKPKRITRSMHLAEGIKTATPSITKQPASNPRRSGAAAQKLTNPGKSNNPVDLSAKNDAGVPIAKIIRTPIFNYKKNDLIKASDPSVPETVPAIALDVEDVKSFPSMKENEEQAIVKDETMKPESADNDIPSDQRHFGENLDEFISSAPAPKHAAPLNLSKLQRPVATSNRSKWLKPAPPVFQLIQPQEEVNPSTSEVESPEHPEVKNNDEDYEEVLEQVEDFEAYLVHKNRFIENRKTRGAQPTVLTSHARRRSSLLKNRRLSNQYVSLAEAIKKFEKGTPTRFHTVSTKNPKPKALQTVKQQALKPTVPKSPALTSKNRVRRHVVLSRAELEEIELQKIKQHKIRANPVPTNILQGPQPLKTVPRKPLTSQKPFHLSKPKKTVTAKKDPHPSTSASSSTSGQFHPTKKPTKKIVPTVVNSEGGMTIAETQIMHFGIPTTPQAQVIGSAKKKTTHPLPFNFEERNKLFMNKKEEKLKKLQKEEEQKGKVEFHAKPMPLSGKKVPLQPSKQVKGPAKEHDVEEHHQEKYKPKVLPFSFEARDKVLMKRKEELRKKIEEEEKKARHFHANPAPQLKPVLVRGRSRENIKTDDKNTGTVRNKSAENFKTAVYLNPRGRSAENLRTLIRDKSKESLKPPGTGRVLQKEASPVQLSDHADGNEENRPPNYQPAISKQKSATTVKSTMPLLKPKLKSLPAELHSDKRARMRREFDEQIRIKESMKEQKRRREQEERLAREQAEIKELRKKSEVKARPMPVYRPMAVIKSTKPLTAPESPAWAKSRP